MFRIRKRFTFEAAHQLEEAFTSACSDCVHGHSYTVEMFLTSEKLDDMQMVVDFGHLKEFKKRVMEKWDHGLHLHQDKIQLYGPLIDAGHLKKSKVTFWKVQPTAEAMAQSLWGSLNAYIQLINPTITIEKVRVHETSTGWAEYEWGSQNE